MHTNSIITMVIYFVVNIRKFTQIIMLNNNTSQLQIAAFLVTPLVQKYISQNIFRSKFPIGFDEFVSILNFRAYIVKMDYYLENIIR